MGIPVQHETGLESSIATLRAQISSLGTRLAAAENTFAKLRAALSSEMVARQSPYFSLQTAIAYEATAE